MSLLREMLGHPAKTEHLFKRARGEYVINSECDPWAYGVVQLIQYIEQAEVVEGRTNECFSGELRYLIRIALGEEPLPKDPNP